MTAPGSLFGIYPQRGFVDPTQSGIYALKSGHGPVHLVLDVMENETPEYQARPTQSQTEDAKTISDHVTLNPLKLTIRGIVTDTPVGAPRQYSSAFSGARPSKLAFDYIESLYLNKVPFDFVGGFKVYKSMVVTSFIPVRDAQTGDALRFTAILEQLIIVSSEVAYKPKKKSSQPKSAHGSQPTTPATDIQSKTVIDAVGNGLTASTGETPINFSTPASSAPATTPTGGMVATVGWNFANIF